MVALFGRIDLRLSENPEGMVSMSFPPRIECGINSGGNPVITCTYRLPPHFLLAKAGAGVTNWRGFSRVSLICFRPNLREKCYAVKTR